jgi:hypothetical protein
MTVSQRHLKTNDSFQNGWIPVGRLATSNACSTLHVSMTMKMIDRHIDTNMIPNRGVTITSSTIPNEYTLLIIQTMEIVVKIHQGSLWGCQTGKTPQ